MELTKQYFDEQLGRLNQRFDDVASKGDLQEQTKDLKKFAEEQTDALARIIATTIAEPALQKRPLPHQAEAQ